MTAPEQTCRLRFDAGTLLLSGISQRAMEKIFGPQFWVIDPRSDAGPGVIVWRTDARNYRAVRTALQQRLRGTFVDQVPRWTEVRFPSSRLTPLRPQQRQAVGAWLQQRAGCVVMPTGTGKTEVALQLIARLNTSALVVAPVRDLMYQWHQRILQRLGIDAGIQGDGVHRPRPVMVTTYDSACIHMPRLGNRFELVVFDECHHLPGPIRQDAARMSAAPFRLGLTATADSSGAASGLLETLIGPVVYHQSLAEARGAALADYQVHRIAVHLSSDERRRYDQLSQIVRQYICERRQSDPQFSWQRLCQDSGHDAAARRALIAFHRKRSIEDRAEEKLRVLEDLFRLHAGEPCLIFTGTNAMARDISRRFLVPCLLSHCRRRERADVLEGLQQGRYPAVVANRVLDEGVDLPDIKVAIVVGGSSSPRQAVQRLGRILRKSRYGNGTLYEIVTRDTRDAIRSRRRRATDAYR